MNKSSLVRFRSGSRLASALGIPSDAVGTVMCKYLIANRLVGSSDRVDVSFDGNKVAWGVPVAEFVLVEDGTSDRGTLGQVA